MTQTLLLAEMKGFQPAGETATVDVEDEETLAMNTMTAYYDTLPEGADKMDNVVQHDLRRRGQLPLQKTALTPPIPPTTACGSPASPS